MEYEIMLEAKLNGAIQDFTYHIPKMDVKYPAHYAKFLAVCLHQSKRDNPPLTGIYTIRPIREG